MSSLLTLPLASGIIDDLIGKAKVFGTFPGQFIASFLEILLSRYSLLVGLQDTSWKCCTYVGRAKKKCSHEVRFRKIILYKSVSCVKRSLNLNLNFQDVNNE